ncbi:hypothetical protein EGW08_012790 [Elysia chlorotica]|uniref:Fibrinogen C-terminal domain-containing protein n=1 Tax=Elysia chlorotica TaxID=188477 RepID=A0A3S1A0A3_ELYCH|nr:hypothetical protein EGW08_012790 [Elysia chlorotica]
MDGCPCVIIALCVSCCFGLDLSLVREKFALTGARQFCAILTCTETAKTSTTNNGRAGSGISLHTISSMSVFTTVSSASSSDNVETIIATVTPRDPSVNRVADGRKIIGFMGDGIAMVRVELIKPEDCQSEFSCQVRGLDSEGREAVSEVSLVQQSGQGGDQDHGATRETAATVQLLASVQQLVTQSVAALEDKIEQLQGHFNDRSGSLENRMEDKIGLLQRDMRDQSGSFERRIENRFNSLENRLEDKIDNNNNLNKLIQLDVKVSSSLDEFRTEAKADMMSSLNVLRHEVMSQLEQALRNVSFDVKGTLNETVDLVTSLGHDFDNFKSHGQTNLLTVMNETDRIRDMLTSGENFPHRLWNRTLELNSELLESFKELESQHLNSTAETGAELKELLEQMDSKMSTDLRSLTDVIVPGECKKGVVPYITSQYVRYSDTYPKNSLNVSFLCDTFTDGGGWIVIQRRATGNTDFNRKWAEYKHGFGSFADDFWLGNDKIHAITSTGTYELRVELQYNGKAAFARYDNFSIADERGGYKLSIGAYDGTAGDSLEIHNGQKFTTIDRDNDIHTGINCAATNGGGWWFGECDYSNLNGKWAANNDKGLDWDTFTRWDSASFSMMEIRQV